MKFYKFLTIDCKVKLVATVISTFSIIFIVIVQQEFSSFWKLFSLSVFILWISIIEDIRDAKKKSIDNNRNELTE